jgi:hypothetical protein
MDSKPLSLATAFILGQPPGLYFSSVDEMIAPLCRIRKGFYAEVEQWCIFSGRIKFLVNSRL